MDLKQFRQLGQRAFPVHKIRRANHARLDECQRPPDGARRVMKTREQGEIGIMDERGVEDDAGAGRTAAEEIHRAALAHEMHGGFPNHRLADRLNDRVEMRLGSFAQPVVTRPLPSPMSTTSSAPSRRAASKRGARRPATVTWQPSFLASAANIKPIGPAPMTRTFWPDAQLEVLDALDDTGQRFGERGIAEIGLRLEAQQVFLDEPRGNGDGFGVGAVEEQQIFAQIFLAGAAMKTFAARRGIGHDHAVADLPVLEFNLACPGNTLSA